MRLNELFDRLKEFEFIENFYLADKKFEERGAKPLRVLKMYGEEYKIAEVFLDAPYMLRTTYLGFKALNMVQQQALLQTLYAFASTPLEQRQSELYFAYFSDLNNITHFIKRLSNNRLTDEIIPLASFNKMDPDNLRRYLFTTAELEEFPGAYKPRYDNDSFVQVISQEEMEHLIEERYNRGNEPGPSETDEEKGKDS